MAWRNEAGLPLSGSQWLAAHHQAKVQHRTDFARRISSNPEIATIADIGCGNGLWLDTLAQVSPSRTTLIGLDIDASSLREAKTRADSWDQATEFKQIDLNEGDFELPIADLYLMINTFGYIRKPVNFLSSVKSKMKRGATLLIRQYDGSCLRFGPLKTNERLSLDHSLFAAAGGSTQFQHYAGDQLFEAAMSSSFSSKDWWLENYTARTPFSADQCEYISNMLSWTKQLVSPRDQIVIDSWAEKHIANDPASSGYFYETDFVVSLS